MCRLSMCLCDVDRTYIRELLIVSGYSYLSDIYVYLIT